MIAIDTSTNNLPENFNKYSFTQYLTLAKPLFKKNEHELSHFYNLKNTEITYLKQSLDHSCIVVSNHHYFDSNDINDIIRYIKDPVIEHGHWKLPQILYKIENDFEKLKIVKKYYNKEEIGRFISCAIKNKEFNLIKNLIKCGYEVDDKFSANCALSILEIEDCENINLILNLYSAKNNYKGLQQDILYYMSENIPNDVLENVVNKIGKDTIITIDCLGPNRYVFNGTILELALLWCDNYDLNKNGILNKNIFNYVNIVSDNFKDNMLNGRVKCIDFCGYITYDTEKYNNETIVELLSKIKKYNLNDKIKDIDLI